MLTTLFAIVALGSQATISSDFPKAEEPGIEVKVLVLNFDPMIKSAEKTLREFKAYNDPKSLSDQYIADVDQCSGGYIKYKVAEWRDINAFPIKTDGFAYTEESFLKVLDKETAPHEPDALDYPKILEEHGVVAAIDEGKVDEVWLFGGPNFGFFESCMAGPGAFAINGGVFDSMKSKRPFAIMGFNYERGVAEMLHNLCHRTEATMTRVFGGWNPAVPDTAWAKFAAAVKQTGGFGGVGNCHWPPNAEKEYDYDNRRIVWTNADLYLKYPNLKGRAKPVSRDNWGGPDYHRNYMKWWFARLPKAPKAQRDGRMNNWWKYVFEFTKYDASGKPVR